MNNSSLHLSNIITGGGVSSCAAPNLLAPGRALRATAVRELRASGSRNAAPAENEGTACAGLTRPVSACRGGACDGVLSRGWPSSAAFSPASEAHDGTVLFICRLCI